MGEDEENLKVRIRNTEGKYLVCDIKGVWFANDLLKATVFDYRGHKVAEQLEKLRKTSGIILLPEPIDALEIYERCDRCKRLGMPFQLFFDGKSFLCFDCKR